MWEYCYNYQPELRHHGIKGQKWGVRRFQNPDGSRTAAGKRREQKAASENSGAAKKSSKGRRGAAIATGALATASAAAAAVYLARHPETAVKAKSAVGKAGKKIGNVSVSALKTAKNGLKEGTKEGLQEGPRKVAKAVVIGAVMLSGKKALDKLIGSGNSESIFKANDKKKISNFWKSSDDDFFWNRNNDDEEDEDEED